MGSIKPLARSARLTLLKGDQSTMRERIRDWSFSASAEWVVGALLALAIVVAAFV